MHIFQPDRFLLHLFIARHAPDFEGVVLDIGGGTRRYANLFTHCTFTILDLDPHSHPDIVASAEKIPLKDASVDGILCTQALGDVWNTETAISEMLRALKPGGRLLITESLFNEEHDAPHDYWRFTQYAWKRLLEERCETLHIEPRGGYFSQKLQQKIRYNIERHRLYSRPFLGKLFSLWATFAGKHAIAKDARAKSDIGTHFPIGYNIIGTKKNSELC